VRRPGEPQAAARFDDLPPLRESLAEAAAHARHSLGQHFLLDLNITRKIARLADVGPGDTVVEVGPGPGGLTRALLEAGAEVVAIERDSRFAPLLEALAARAGGRLRVVYADALALDPSGLPAPASVVANLPYNVASALLAEWLTGPWRPSRMTLMFQREVAARLTAAPGTKAYGRLSVLAQARCSVRLLMSLPARAFTPPPKVASAVVRLDPRPDALSTRLSDLLQAITTAAFGQRRKMLRTSLARLGGAGLCSAIGLSPSLRAEDVSVDEYLALAAALEDAPGAPTMGGSHG
jgi:16S rRNA (adenine1518-N6/adenine1519-N6)-dimethyltransferase